VTNSNSLNPGYGRVIDFNFPYQNDENLSNAILALSGDLKGKKLNKILKRISEVTNESLDETKKQYRRFQKELKKFSKEEKQRILGQIKEVKPEYLGSLQQLRFGQLLAEHLDLNPVFSALLSPTGGMIGPGSVPRNIWFYSEKGVLAYHAAVHDAAGFLCNRKNIMPGYEYITNDQEPCERSPLAGQFTGILYWYRKLKKLRRTPRAEVSVTDISIGLDFEEPFADIWVDLEESELFFITSIIDPKKKDFSEEEERQFEEGRTKLLDRNLITGKDGKFDIDDDLIAMVAVSEHPQNRYETQIEGIGRSEPILKIYQADEFIVEKSYPKESLKRFSFVKDPKKARTRIESVISSVSKFDRFRDVIDQESWNRITVTSYTADGKPKDSEDFPIPDLPSENILTPLESEDQMDIQSRLKEIIDIPMEFFTGDY
jgi:hypothetical protein